MGCDRGAIASTAIPPGAIADGAALADPCRYPWPSSRQVDPARRRNALPLSEGDPRATSGSGASIDLDCRHGAGLSSDNFTISDESLRRMGVGF